MALKCFVLLVTLVAAVSAGYSSMPFGTYSNAFAVSAGPYPTTMASDRIFSNYNIDNTNMHNSAGIYQSYMPMNERMSLDREASSVYGKHSLMERTMPNAMPNGLNVRYTSTPSAMYQGGQQYGQKDVGHGRMMMPHTDIAYNNGAQMAYNGNRMSMSRGAAQGYSGYAHPPMMEAPTVRPFMSNYDRPAEGHMMKMMNDDGHYMHQMPSSYVSYSGSGANYRW